MHPELCPGRAKITHMGEVGSAAALLLAAVFSWAGASKLARADTTAPLLRAVGVPLPRAVARTIPFLELAVAAALITIPRAGGIAALVLLGGFSVVLVLAIRGGVDQGCGCFGARPGGRVGWAEVVRNGLLEVLAVAALAITRVTVPSPPAALVVLGGALGGWVLVTMVRAMVDGADPARTGSR